MSKYRYIPIAGGGGETPVLETLNATQNGQYLPEEGVTGWNEVNVNVPASEVDSGTKQTTMTTNGTQTVDVVGYANHEVSVQVPASEVDSGTKQVSINQNGVTTEDVTGYADVEIDVDVQPNLQSKTATQNGLVEPDQDYDGLSAVDVQVPAPYWSGTQAQYDVLPSYSNDMLYLIIN